MDIFECGLHGVVACVRTVDVVGELALVAIVAAQGVEQIGIEVFPLLERKVLAEDAGRDVQRDECRFDEQRS